MLRKAMLGLLLMTAWQAQADYQWPVKLQDDFIIPPQTVQVIGQRGTLTITPAGEVQRNGRLVPLDAGQRQQAQAYQSALRRDLPWIDEGARAHLEKGARRWIRLSSNSLAATVTCAIGSPRWIAS